MTPIEENKICMLKINLNKLLISELHKNTSRLKYSINDVSSVAWGIERSIEEGKYNEKSNTI